MVNYLDSRRIMGTTAERSSIPVPATQGGWVELGRTTLGANGDTITVSSLPNKRYYMILTDIKRNANYNPYMRLGSGGTLDTGSNYSDRTQYQGLTDVTYTSQTYYNAYSGGSAYPSFWVQYLANYSTKEKLSLMHGNIQSTAGAGTAPIRYEVASKWANTSNAIDVFQVNNTAGGSGFASGSEVVVLGWDPADSHTNNFWEELASYDASGAATTIDSGTFTAKKYLWVQYYFDSTSSIPTNIQMYFNSDNASSNYAMRDSNDGGADSTTVSQNMAQIFPRDTLAHFGNMFIINNTSNEKLCILHTVHQSTAGAATAPARDEEVLKWANTSAQITRIRMQLDLAATFGSNSFMRVWGAN